MYNPELRATQNTEQNPDIALYHIEIILLYYIY